ncbi:MAG: hypothetical protein A2161_00205 [Candidatus Schekmanbacteria bacterium RBG_13_48_7]|uniref:Transglycosylase SLT domain-containing protein n=1 Tax=Candidatus Schekmanbacteria bacterium RBG_13_48_7 TaxID=1817878 RepID=A0A1F7S5C7_9BACT|nr:MAG: hypothetical protein A2161_00205 [Candidatus Schekmanbacteria bacterium RBG_13_48_7]
MLPERIKRLVYPAGFAQTIKTYANEYKVESELIAAIIYQESRFNPDAVSPAAAKGLMQIIPRTGGSIAKNLEKSDYHEKSLLNPVESIRMGTYYFKQLMEQFDNRVDVALASYNGGPYNAKRWLNFCKSDDMLEFIGAISFKETRNYVKIVLTNYYIYKELYKNGEDWF